MPNMDNKKRERGIYRVTIIGGIVNAILVIFKFIAGILGNSAAMVADAVHSLSDFATDVIVLVFVRVSNKPHDDCHKYGHGKFETLATFIIGLILMLIGIGIAWNGTSNIISVINGATLERPGMLALIAAIISIVAKELLYWYTVTEGKKLRSNAVIANAWHHRSDALSSTGTTLGIGGAIFLGSKWTVLDPIAALVVSIIIIVMAFRLMKPAVDELMEKSLPDETLDEIVGIVKSFGDVSGLHNLYTRKIGNNYAIEFHIRMDGKTSLEEAHRVITEIETELRAKYGPGTHVMIHMEPLKAAAC